jgi:[amino group carrier protein]-lysine/ornithine hydrolase
MDEVGVLRSLLEAYSPSDHEEDAVRTFVELAGALGFAAHADREGNGIARIGTGRPKVMFLGHIDTVEGPIPVRLEGGRIHGRGACDAKGALAAALAAGSRHVGPGQITVVGAVGEERDSRGARFLIPRHRPDFLIVGEPSGWAGVTIGYRGNLSLRVRFDGGRSHLSSPDPTTVEAGLAFVERLRGFCDAHHGDTRFHSLTAKVHTIDTRRAGGEEHVEVGVNVRLPPGVRVDEVLAFLQEEGLADRTEVVDRSEAVAVDPRNEVVRALCAGIRRAGSRPTLVRKLGTSDLNLAVPAWGCPAAAYGPGDSHLDHTDSESLEVDEFRRSIEVLQGAFVLLTARPPPPSVGAGRAA